MHEAGEPDAVGALLDADGMTGTTWLRLIARPEGFNRGRMLGMKFVVTIDRDEDGVWITECPAIPGCVSQGATRGAALENIAEAIALCLEVRAEHGLPLTVETREIEVVA